MLESKDPAFPFWGVSRFAFSSLAKVCHLCHNEEMPCSATWSKRGQTNQSWDSLIVPSQKNLRLNHSTMDQSPREIVFDTCKTKKQTVDPDVAKSQLYVSWRSYAWKSCEKISTMPWRRASTAAVAKLMQVCRFLRGFAGSKCPSLGISCVVWCKWSTMKLGVQTDP